MNWDNKTVLEFLELYQMHSCIWDPNHKSYKNRQHVKDAWNNIRETLGVACSVKDLKRKKESLMAAYRHYKSKIKKSERLGSTLSDVYQPVWFAFPYMDAFLGPLYGRHRTESTEDEETIEEANTTNTAPEDESESKSTTSNQETFFTPIPSTRRQKNPRQKNPPEPVPAKQRMEKAFNFMKEVSQDWSHPKIEDNDECTIFGQLIARKMRKLSDERRDVMMVKINQLFVDEHTLSSPKDPCAVSTRNYTPSPQYQVVFSPRTQTALGEVEDIEILDESSDPVKSEVYIREYKRSRR